VAFPYPYPDRIAEKAVSNFITDIGLRSTGPITVPYPEDLTEGGGFNSDPVAGLWTDKPLVYSSNAVAPGSRIFDDEPRSFTFAHFTTLGDGTAGANTYGSFNPATDVTRPGSVIAYWRNTIYWVSVAERITYLILEQQWSNYADDSLVLSTATVSPGSISAPSFVNEANLIGTPFGTKQYIYGGDDTAGCQLIPTPGVTPGVIAIWFTFTTEDTDNLNGRTNGWRWDQGNISTGVALWDCKDPLAHTSFVLAAVPAISPSDYSSALVSTQAPSETTTEGFEAQSASWLTLVRYRPTELYTETEPNQFDLNPADSFHYTARLRHPTLPDEIWEPELREVKAVDQEFVLVVTGGKTVVLVNREWTSYRILNAVANDEDVCTAFTEADLGDRFTPNLFKVEGEWMWLFREQTETAFVLPRNALLAKEGPVAGGFSGCLATPPFEGGGPPPTVQSRSFFTSTQMLLEGDPALDAVLFNP
jgi:hypothetical protein